LLGHGESAAGGKLVYEIKKHTDWITALEFSPDGARLATGDRSGAILLWEAASGGTVGALAFWAAEAITTKYLKSPGALVRA